MQAEIGTSFSTALVACIYLMKFGFGVEAIYINAADKLVMQ